MPKSFAPDYDRDTEGRVLFPRDTDLRALLFPYTDPTEHIAKANMHMVRELVEFASEPGETILDPFAGTGTILVACTLWRKVIMIEIEEHFQKTIEQNIKGLRNTFPDADEFATVIPGDCSKILPIPEFCNHMIFCLHPDTKVLRADLSWTPLGTVNLGDVLIGVDEQPLPGAYKRKLRYSPVTSISPVKLPSSVITLGDDRVIIASNDHLWLEHFVIGKAGQAILKWTKTSNLRPGAILKQLTGETWELATSREAGYLAGMLDAEGNLEGFVEAHKGKRTLHGYRVCFSQKAGDTFNLVEKIWNSLGLRGTSDKPNKQNMRKIRTTGLAESLRVLGRIKPPRLLNSFNIDGIGLPQTRSLATVAAVIPLGNLDLIAIGTETKTLIAEGLVSHNSPPYSNILKKKGEMDKTSVDLGYGSATLYTQDPENIGNLNDFLYYQKMEKVYKKFYNSIIPDGTMTIIIKDRMIAGKRICLADRAERDCLRIGFELVERNKWYARGGGYAAINRAHGLETVDEEDLITLRRIK